MASNSITIDDIIRNVRKYNDNQNDIQLIYNAFTCAEKHHGEKGQMRQSGEPYIIHPLSVAFILSKLEMDAATIAAGLLHDVIEDTDVTKEIIAYKFGEEIAMLVDGVTKIKGMDYLTKDESTVLNQRKLLTAISEDIRILFIKLADRLHNMETIDVKSIEKQKENALETLEIFIPLAKYIGAYFIKDRYEDICLRILRPNAYDEISNMLNKAMMGLEGSIDEVIFNISKILGNNGISNDIDFRWKNIYGIFDNLSHGKKIQDIHDLIALKIKVNDIKDCYIALGLIHSLYAPFNGMFKDYISRPKDNMYQSLHSTIFGSNNQLMQVQIRTFEMDKVASLGIMSYWNMQKGDISNCKAEDLRKRFKLFKSLIEINNLTKDNFEFINEIRKELLSSFVMVYDEEGREVRLPIGSKTIDYAYNISADIGHTMVAAIVNGNYVNHNYILNNGDRVKIVTNPLSFGPRDDWEEIAANMHTKKLIREFREKMKI